MDTRTKTRDLRLEVSIMLSLTSLLFTVPVLFFLPWFWSPTSSGENWDRERFLSLGVHILFIGLNLTSVITAFHNRPGLKSSCQAKTAILLAGLVAGLILPFSLYELYLFFKILFPI